MGAILAKCMGAVDEGKVNMAIDKGFNAFDTNHNGYLEVAEARSGVRKALDHLPMGAKVTNDMIDKAFTKYSGPDQRLDKQEFANMVWPLVEKVGGPKRVARAGGAGMTPAGAAAAADTTAVA